MKPIHNCRYSKALFQSHPRTCLVCGQPEFEVLKEELPQQNDVREDDVEKLAKEWFELKGHNIYNHYNEMPAFIEGYNKCKENTYTEEQVREIIEMSRDIKFIAYSVNDIINFQSLKQLKQ